MHAAVPYGVLSRHVTLLHFSPMHSTLASSCCNLCTFSNLAAVRWEMLPRALSFLLPLVSVKPVFLHSVVPDVLYKCE